VPPMSPHPHRQSKFGMGRKNVAPCTAKRLPRSSNGWKPNICSAFSGESQTLTFVSCDRARSTPAK
jgi:hypothetical protein